MYIGPVVQQSSHRGSTFRPETNIGSTVIFYCFPVLSKTPGCGLFWRDRMIPRMNTFGLEWVSPACFNLPRWNGSRCLGGPISIALPYLLFPKHMKRNSLSIRKLL